MRLRCRLGFHEFERTTPTDHPVDHRTCRHCDRFIAEWDTEATPA